MTRLNYNTFMDDQSRNLLRLKNDIILDISYLKVSKRISANPELLIQIIDFLIAKNNFDTDIQVLDYLRLNEDVGSGKIW